MKTGIIIQARMGSTRLPNKVMLEFNNNSVLGHLVDNVSNTLPVYIATSTNKENDIIKAKFSDIVFRGSENDVMKRTLDCAYHNKLDVIVEITADCPLITSRMIDRMLEEFKLNDYDYISNCWPKRLVADGFDIQIYYTKRLRELYETGKRFDHVGYHLHDKNYIRIGQFGQGRNVDKCVTLDTIEDYVFLSRLLREIPSTKLNYNRINDWLDEQDDIENKDIKRKIPC